MGTGGQILLPLWVLGLRDKGPVLAGCRCCRSIVFMVTFGASAFAGSLTAHIRAATRWNVDIVIALVARSTILTAPSQKALLTLMLDAAGVTGWPAAAFAVYRCHFGAGVAPYRG